MRRELVTGCTNYSVDIKVEMIKKTAKISGETADLFGR